MQLVGDAFYDGEDFSIGSDTTRKLVCLFDIPENHELVVLDDFGDIILMLEPPTCQFCGKMDRILSIPYKTNFKYQLCPECYNRMESKMLEGGGIASDDYKWKDTMTFIGDAKYVDKVITISKRSIEQLASIREEMPVERWYDVYVDEGKIILRLRPLTCRFCGNTDCFSSISYLHHSDCAICWICYNDIKSKIIKDGNTPVVDSGGGANEPKGE